MQRQQRVRLLPAPHAFLGDRRAAEVRRSNVPVAGFVDAGDPFERGGGFHGPLDVFRIAEVQEHHLAEHLNTFFVTVQFVGLNGREAVDEQALLVEGVHVASQ